MLKSYLNAASSHLIRHKSYAVITILGLVLGMASCTLILLFVQDELRYDKWIPGAESVFRYETTRVDQSGTARLFRKSALRARRDLQQYFPQEIEAATRMIDYRAVLSVDTRQYFETVWFVDPGFLDVFRLPMSLGDSSALVDKSSILISAQMAAKYFPGESPLGQLLVMDGGRDFTVSGVFADVPEQSHVSPDFVLLYDENDPQYGFGYSESWTAVEGYTYVRLREGIDARAINARLTDFLRNFTPDFVVPAGKQFSDIFQPVLLNVLDIHLHPGGVGNIKPPGNRQVLVTLSLIALLVLLIASFNFVNLSTVRSLGRVREMSVRKAIGAQRLELVFQFLCESVLASLLALVAAVSIVEVLLPWYNALLGRDIAMKFFSSTAAIILAGALALGVCSGLYPAWRLSSPRPAHALRGGSSGAQGQHWLQSLLVVGQFAISATLVITTLTVLMQQTFIANSAPGFSSERKLVIRNLNEVFARDKRDLIASGLNGLSGVAGTAFSAATPADTIGAAFFRPVTAPGYREESFQLFPKSVGSNFFELYEIPLLAGRSFSEAFANDTFFWPAANASETSFAAAVLNESAVKSAGFSSAEDAIGKTISMDNMQLQVIGVVPDVHFQSLRSAITPNLYIMSPNDFVSLTLSYAANTDEQQLLTNIDRVWKEHVPGIPLAYEFLEDNIAAQYVDDHVQLLLIGIFSGLALTIACMGLYALAAHSTRQRTREISIRKIHGALRSDILVMLLLQFSKPIALANVLAWPVALYVVTRYLQGFVYRIDPQWSVFVLVSLAILFIAWAAIIFHVIKVASTAPATVLRHE